MRSFIAKRIHTRKFQRKLVPPRMDQAYRGKKFRDLAPLVLVLLLVIPVLSVAGAFTRDSPILDSVTGAIGGVSFGFSCLMLASFGALKCGLGDVFGCLRFWQLYAGSITSEHPDPQWTKCYERGNSVDYPEHGPVIGTGISKKERGEDNDKNCAEYRQEHDHGRFLLTRLEYAILFHHREPLKVPRV